MLLLVRRGSPRTGFVPPASPAGEWKPEHLLTLGRMFTLAERDSGAQAPKSRFVPATPAGCSSAEVVLGLGAIRLIDMIKAP
jgi:hypothetical protein